MALLELQNITAGYDKNVILKDLDFQVEEGELVSLLGSSGCGKTTTLRLIAGFSTPMSGKFMFGGKDYTQVPLNKRNFGFVFQSYALFPHMTVFDNVAFGLKMRKVSRDLDIISSALTQAAGISHQPVMQTYICVGILDFYHNVAVAVAVRIANLLDILSDPLLTWLRGIDHNIFDVTQFSAIHCSCSNPFHD